MGHLGFDEGLRSSSAVGEIFWRRRGASDAEKLFDWARIESRGFGEEGIRRKRAMSSDRKRRKEGRGTNDGRHAATFLSLPLSLSSSLFSSSTSTFSYPIYAVHVTCNAPPWRG